MTSIRESEEFNFVPCSHKRYKTTNVVCTFLSIFFLCTELKWSHVSSSRDRESERIVHRGCWSTWELFGMLSMNVSFTLYYKFLHFFTNLRNIWPPPTHCLLYKMLLLLKFVVVVVVVVIVNII